MYEVWRAKWIFFQILKGRHFFLILKDHHLTQHDSMSFFFFFSNFNSPPCLYLHFFFNNFEWAAMLSHFKEEKK